MKVSGRQITGFLKSPPPDLKIVLVYGPDEGKAREFAQSLARAVVGSVDDAFNTVEITAQRLKDDPSAIIDEMAAISLMGGRRLVKVLNAPDSLTPKIQDGLAVNSDTLVVIEGAASLNGRSKLVKLLEAAPNGAAVACYPDDARDLPPFVSQELKSLGVQCDAATLDLICSRLGPDRGLNRRELEKLALGSDKNGILSAETVGLLLGDSAESDLEALCFAVLDGRLDRLLWAMNRLEAENTAAPRVLSAVSRHVDRMHRAKAAIEAGKPAKEALGQVGFRAMLWKLEPALNAQLKRWSTPKLAWAMERLLEADRSCRSTGAPATVLTRAALFDLSRAARQ